jgi:hypothetical protein
MSRQILRENKSFIGRSALAVLFASAPAAFAGCAATRTPEPNDARTISCTTPGRDCSQEADQICPSGYKTLESESYSYARDDLTSSSPGEPQVTHKTLLIECTPST